MSALPTRARSCWVTLVAVVVATAMPVGATAATTVDQGPIAGSVVCSDVVTVDTTCVLPFGAPATSNVVVTSIAFGDPEPAVAVARPVDGTPGRWTISPVGSDPTRWKLRHNTGGEGSIFDVRIPLRPGDQLVLVDPRIILSGSTRDLDPANVLLTVATDGQTFPITPVGRVVVEDDTDADGFGDDSQDACRGVARRFCSAAIVKVALSGPAYVPSQRPVAWRWSITNESSDPQPMAVNLYSPEADPTVTGPNGAVCGRGQPRSVFDAWGIPSSVSVERPPGTFSYPNFPRTLVPTGNGYFVCVLAPVAPGETVSGTIGGSGGLGTPSALRIEALVPAVNSGTLMASTLLASASFEHARPGAASPDWKAYEILQGKVTRTGRWPVTAICGGPLKADSCTVSAVANAPRGGAVLGTAAPVSAKPGTPVPFTVVFSKAGLKWLSTHRKSSVDLQITTVAPDETPAVTTDRSKPALTPALRRHFARLAAKAKKKAGKR